jgi:hypothetical protein
MPVFLAALIGGLVSAAGSFVGSALISLGISAITFYGVKTLVDNVKAHVFSYLQAGAGVEGFMSFIGVLQVGTCINILFSAYVVRLTLRGLRGDAIKRFSATPK